MLNDVRLLAHTKTSTDTPNIQKYQTLFFRLSFPLNNRWLVVVVGEINSESANKLWCKSHVSIVSLYSCTIACEPYMRRVDNMKQMHVNKKIRTQSTKLLFHLTCASHLILLSCTNICYQLDGEFVYSFGFDANRSNRNRCTLCVFFYPMNAWKIKRIKRKIIIFLDQRS